MKIAFYKGLNRLPYPKPLDIAVCVGTLSAYSHVEIIFSDGLWFTSSPRDGGTRFKNIIPKSYTWDIYALGVSSKAESMIRSRAIELVKHEYKYDVIGAVFSGMGACLRNDKLFCSEAVTEVLSAALSDMPKPCETRPVDLYRHLADNGVILPIY